MQFWHWRRRFGVLVSKTGTNSAAQDVSELRPLKRGNSEEQEEFTFLAQAVWDF